MLLHYISTWVENDIIVVSFLLKIRIRFCKTFDEMTANN